MFSPVYLASLLHVWTVFKYNLFLFVFFFFIAANIVIQTEPPPAVPENTNLNRVVVEPERKRPLGIMNDGPFAKKPWADK